MWNCCQLQRNIARSFDFRNIANCIQIVDLYNGLIKNLNIGVRDGGQGGGQLPPPPQRLQSRKVGQMLNISRAKRKLKSQKAKSPQFVGQTKAVGQYSLHSRAILAYYKRNWDKLCQFCG